MQRTREQPSLADALVERRRRPRYERLRRIDEAIDWAPFERILAVVHNSPRGRPAFPALPLFKALLLKEWHSLSDEQLEEELLDRTSYRQFCGYDAPNSPLDGNLSLDSADDALSALADISAAIDPGVDQVRDDQLGESTDEGMISGVPVQSMLGLAIWHLTGHASQIFGPMDN